jgi:hypothetical protein
MTEHGSRNIWLRMTDRAGLTEPGKKPPTQSPKLLLFQTIVWSASFVLWLSFVIRDGGQTNILHGALVVMSLSLAVANFLMLMKSKKR